MPILKAIKGLLNIKVEVDKKDIIIKVGDMKCVHHHCIDRRDYHVTCLPKCATQRHLRNVKVCCECGQENYSAPHYFDNSTDCGIKDDNWKKKNGRGSLLR